MFLLGVMTHLVACGIIDIQVDINLQSLSTVFRHVKFKGSSQLVFLIFRLSLAEARK